MHIIMKCVFSVHPQSSSSS